MSCHKVIMKTDNEYTGKGKVRALFEKVTNPLGSIRPAGVFGFLLVIVVYYLYKNIQLGNF